MKYFQKNRRLIARLVGIFIVAVFISGGLLKTASAITTQDLSDILNGYTYYRASDDGSSTATCSPSSSGSPSSGSGSTAYLLGDSIAVSANSVYQTTFSGKGVQTTVDGSSGRSINVGGTDGNKLSGLSAIESDKDIITSSKILIIALGTNGNNTAQDVDNLINAIRLYNPSAPLYWVDTTVIGRPDYQKTVIKTSNLAIYNEATTKKYTVISWFKTVTPGGDPINPTGTETDAGNYIVATDGVNALPTTAGITALASLVAGAITGQPTGNTSGSCSGNLVGNDNETKVYNYLIGKGLTPVQVAGIMGNLQAEAHFEPKLVEYGQINCRGEKSVQGEPSSFCDTLIVNGTTGYGIAQWTSAGRQQALLDFANSKGTIAGDLSIQLDFLWQEMTTSYNNSVLTPLKATADLRVATDIVLMHFECPTACDQLGKDPVNTPEKLAAYQAVLDERFTKYSQPILIKYGSV